MADKKQQQRYHVDDDSTDSTEEEEEITVYSAFSRGEYKMGLEILEKDTSCLVDSTANTLLKEFDNAVDTIGDMLDDNTKSVGLSIGCDSPCVMGCNNRGGGGALFKYALSTIEVEYHESKNLIVYLSPSLTKLTTEVDSRKAMKKREIDLDDEDDEENSVIEEIEQDITDYKNQKRKKRSSKNTQKSSKNKKETSNKKQMTPSQRRKERPFRLLRVISLRATTRNSRNSHGAF